MRATCKDWRGLARGYKFPCTEANGRLLAVRLAEPPAHSPALSGHDRLFDGGHHHCTVIAFLRHIVVCNFREFWADDPIASIEYAISGWARPRQSIQSSFDRVAYTSDGSHKSLRGSIRIP